VKLPYVDPFAVRLKARREQLDLTQKQLAGMMGIADKRFIYRYEHGLRQPKVSRIRELCVALNVDADWLLGLTTNRPSRPLPAPARPNLAAPNQTKPTRDER